MADSGTPDGPGETGNREPAVNHGSTADAEPAALGIDCRGPAALSIDCRGMACPRPIIELARRICDVSIGSSIELLADDPAAGADLVAWCRMRGQQLELTAAPRFVVRRLR